MGLSTEVLPLQLGLGRNQKCTGGSGVLFTSTLPACSETIVTLAWPERPLSKAVRSSGDGVGTWGLGVIKVNGEQPDIG